MPQAYPHSPGKPVCNAHLATVGRLAAVNRSWSQFKLNGYQMGYTLSLLPII